MYETEIETNVFKMAWVSELGFPVFEIDLTKTKNSFNDGETLAWKTNPEPSFQL